MPKIFDNDTREAPGDSPRGRRRTSDQSGVRVNYRDRPKLLRNLALLGGPTLLVLSVVLGISDGRAKAERDQDQQLRTAAGDVRADIQNYFERARALNLLLANNPAFASFYTDGRTRIEKVKDGTIAVRQANAALDYLQQLYPGRIGEACFIDRSGAENARVVRGVVAKPDELSLDEAENEFFAPTFALAPGFVYQAKPYISPDTNELVISNSTLIAAPKALGKPAIVHFEVTVESFRREIADNNAWMRIADAQTGEVIADSRFPIVSSAGNNQPKDMTLTSLAGRERPTGSVDIGPNRIAYTRIETGDSNDNKWVVVASANKAGVDYAALLLGWPAAMMAGALGMLGLAGLGFRSYQRELRRQALTDDLTGLPNRSLFRDRVERSVALAKRKNGSTAVMILDVDRFKEVNDTLGHHHGDLLLQQVGQRLATAVRDSDTVSRLGGDEFGVLLAGIDDREDIHIVSDRIKRSLADPLTLDGVPVQVDMSLGVAIYPEHADEMATLIQRADIAMYQVKSVHGGFGIYDQARDTFSQRRLAMVPELRNAIEQGTLDLHYQPKVVITTGEVEGVEALTRWTHPEFGTVEPTEFIRLAEDTGLIRSLTLVILEKAVTQAAEWKKAGRPLRVSVNISTLNLLEPAFASQVSSRLMWTGLPPGLLQLEITESMFMTDTEAALETINALHEIGVGLSIDDFGTGYSSLTYLRQLPVQELKIDKSFVAGMQGNEADVSIVRSTISLGQNLGFTIVAEGVEDADTLATLTALGCDHAQGFLITHALAPEDLFTWLDEHCSAASMTQADAAPAASPATGFSWLRGPGAQPAPG